MNIFKLNGVVRVKRVCLTSILCLLALGARAADKVPESDQPIKILLNDWTSQLVLAKVTGGIFSNMGYQVEYVQKSSSAQWGSLKLGLSHVQVEVWEGTMAKMFDRMVAANVIVDAGSHDAKTREEWWYPDYVEALCPGLPDWKALKDCSEIFATDETSPRGRYLGGPWEKPDAARIRALGLKFKAVNAKNGDELWVELDKFNKNKQPIVLFNWTPNWVEAKYDGKFIEFPEYDPACETDPKWGENEKFLHDCGNPKNGWLKKAAWINMEQQWPCAFHTLTAINFSNAMIAELAMMVDIDGKTYDQAAAIWLEKNIDVWKTWIPNDCQKDH